MKGFKTSIAIAAGILALSTGVAFADNLHNLIPDPNLNPASGSAAPGQTGSNVLASCEATTDYFSIGADAKTSSGAGSPFNPDATKKYAGNPGSPATNPNAVSQYDRCYFQRAHQVKQPRLLLILLLQQVSLLG